MTKKAELSRKAHEARFMCVLNKVPAEEVDELIPDNDAEFQQIADATMSWWTLLFASGIIAKGTDKEERNLIQETLASALVSLGSLIKYVYALGLRRGMRRVQKKRKK